MSEIALILNKYLKQKNNTDSLFYKKVMKRTLESDDAIYMEAVRFIFSKNPNCLDSELYNENCKLIKNNPYQVKKDKTTGQQGKSGFTKKHINEIRCWQCGKRFYPFKGTILEKRINRLSKWAYILDSNPQTKEAVHSSGMFTSNDTSKKVFAALRTVQWLYEDKAIIKYTSEIMWLENSLPFAPKELKSIIRKVILILKGERFRKIFYNLLLDGYYLKNNNK